MEHFLNQIYVASDDCVGIWEALDDTVPMSSHLFGAGPAQEHLSEEKTPGVTLSTPREVAPVAPPPRDQELSTRHAGLDGSQVPRTCRSALLASS